MNPEIEAALARLDRSIAILELEDEDGKERMLCSLKLMAVIRTSPPTPELLALVRAINGGAK